ncbi:hypothetical protein HMPREF0044_0446 [Gleimia coleocanis DSM 15436]|uniref:PemK-like protein n=1 Tax=Gleimia coleocanis DSM 15436 TaxID=525245 RepID=C0VZ56_9ACTO|nr:type II toxin-antitoxin system PemK/MazF family toxin [Gleimia coleocanis]EEH64709.1 hypothetical protein HMPREF0044_0446 [Gleimia coleocanis DSM 15436]
MNFLLDLLLDIVTLILAPGGERSKKKGSKKEKPQPSDPHSDAPVPHDSYFLPENMPLPDFEYRPSQDGNADPGEVVWAWVPYEDNPTQGKDRPVLVLAEIQNGFVCAQMTSKNHKDFKETRWGRRWMDIGTGSWDRQHRNSEVRLDRFVFVPAHAVRREGGRVNETTYKKVVTAIKALR